MFVRNELTSRFGIDASRGFLPARDPLVCLPPAFDQWEAIGHELPKLLTAGRLRRVLDALPVLDLAALQHEDELNRAMLLLSYFGQAYVWGEHEPAGRIPAGFAVPWHALATRLGRPPLLSYASYALHNWRRLDPTGPIALGNIVLLQNFLGGVDEEWFVLVHVDIEAKAGPGLIAAVEAQKAAERGDTPGVETQLQALVTALEKMYATLLRMPEHCDPYIYFHRVRPYIHGWKDNPALPDGVIYKGVEAYGGRPQKFRGETGAQSSIVPSLDAALGIEHEDDRLRRYLREMRDYMPPKHRAFIAALEDGPSIRAFVEGTAAPGLTKAYNDCVQLLAEFRAKHLEYAARYIQQQSQRSKSNPSSVGTGGTPFMRYLKKHQRETEAQIVAAPDTMNAPTATN